MATRTVKVLLIEDDVGDAELLREMLPADSDVRFELECVDRLAPGLKRLSEGGIDLVLLDLSLPDSHGFDSFDQVHSQASTVPIIVLSGLEDETIMRKALAKGACDYLIKGLTERGAFALSLHKAIKRKGSPV